MWHSRYFLGSWEVDNGPKHYLRETLLTINALTAQVVGRPLYSYIFDEDALQFPSAENTHRYEDAHKELYRFLIDAIDKKTIANLASHLSSTKRFDSKNTVTAITELFPSLASPSDFGAALAVVSEQRHKAGHGEPEKASPLGAFSRFTKDLELCLDGAQQLLLELEEKLGALGDKARKRNDALKWLPKLGDGPTIPFISYQESVKMEGRTIEKVGLASREHHPALHGSEALLIYFTDGSIMGIDTGSNVQNIMTKQDKLKPHDFHVDFRFSWVPPLTG